MDPGIETGKKRYPSPDLAKIFSEVMISQLQTSTWRLQFIYKKSVVCLSGKKMNRRIQTSGLWDILTKDKIYDEIGCTK
jgi:hypothetical protein